MDLRGFMPVICVAACAPSASSSGTSPAELAAEPSSAVRTAPAADPTAADEAPRIPVLEPPEPFTEEEWTPLAVPTVSADGWLGCAEPARRYAVGPRGYLAECRHGRGRHGRVVVLDAQGRLRERYLFERGALRRHELHRPDRPVVVVEHYQTGPIATRAMETRDGLLHGRASAWDRDGRLVESDRYHRGALVPDPSAEEILRAARELQRAIAEGDDSRFARRVSPTTWVAFDDARLLALRADHTALARAPFHQQVLVLLMRAELGAAIADATMADLVRPDICSIACSTIEHAELGTVHVLGRRANIELLRDGAPSPDGARLWFVANNGEWLAALDELFELEDARSPLHLRDLATLVAKLRGIPAAEELLSPPN